MALETCRDTELNICMVCAKKQMITMPHNWLAVQQNVYASEAVIDFRIQKIHKLQYFVHWLNTAQGKYKSKV